MAVGVGALVGKVLDMVISTISSDMQQRVRLVAGVNNEVDKVKNNLESIQAVLIDADRRQLKEASVQLWLERLKEVTHDIEDVFDEWSYEITKSQIQTAEKAHEPPSKVPNILNNIASNSFFPGVVSRHHIAVKINDLNERLDTIAKQKDVYGFLRLPVNNEQDERTITTSVIDVSEVKGRDADKEKLLKMLFAEKSHVSNLRVIPVVGMGGVGKTTLVKLVYHDERVKSHFDKRIWVCVSDPFDETRITREILESLKDATPNLVSLPKMMEKLQESVQGLKILFVLDDVWNEDPNKWKQLGDCLKNSLPGSGLLVTTRNGNVGKAMGYFESDIYRVGLLSDEESWELFCMVAFSRKSSGERASLEEIGRKVVRRCKGLPLAVRTIAGLLQFKVSRLEWLNVLESEFWELEEVRRDILAPLWLSYYNLPSPLKQCFLYCAIFPKDREMEKNELIELWMTQGYIKGTQSKDLETTGDEYFQNLVMRSLFQDVKVKKNYFGVTETWCKMHDLVHDFAQSLVKKECLSMQLDDDGLITLDDSFGTSLRHLSIHFRRKLKCPNSFYTLRKLHSLHISTPMIVTPKSFGLDLEKIFNGFTSLRSLRLVDCGVEKIPSNINKLIHLRELDLSCNYRILELPDSLWELCNLQTLILSKCLGIKSLKGLGRLTNLRHINNSGADFLLPKEMMGITGLRRLWEVKVDVDNEETFSLKHLKNFNQLGGLLQISWSNRCDGDVEDAKQAQMNDKKHITELHLELCSEGTERTTKQDEDLMEALTAPPNLEILQIAFYTGLKPPSWMTFLTSLKMVHLYCWTCEHLPALGDLRCLEDLELQGLDRVKKVSAEFLGTDLFPELRTLRFACFIDWEEWNDIEGVEEMPIMPNLISLELDDCPKLKALPRFILQKTRLKLEIENCDALEESTR